MHLHLCSYAKRVGHSMLEGCGYEVLRSFGFWIKFVLWHFGQWFIFKTALQFIRLMRFSSTCHQRIHWHWLLAICTCSDSVYLTGWMKCSKTVRDPDRTSYICATHQSLSLRTFKKFKVLASQKDLTTGPHLCRICMVIPQIFPLFTSLCVANHGKQLLLLCLKIEWFTSVI